MSKIVKYRIAVLLILGVSMILGCSKSGNLSPVEPTGGGANPFTASNDTGQSNRLILGVWDIAYDKATSEFVATPIRESAFHANVVQFLQKPANLGLKVFKADYVTGEFMLDVTLVHPFPKSDLRGFDVHGIVFGSGALSTSVHDTGIKWLAPTGLRVNNADGWTRWWNPVEFTTPGLFGYTAGAFGTKGFTCQATLNPYKYFSNALNPTTEVVPFVNKTNRGTFSTTGGSLTRRYELTFPVVGGVPDGRFQYVADANWVPATGGGSVPGLSDYPPEANCPEAYHIRVEPRASTVYYNSPTERGGDVVLEIEVFDWGAATNLSGVEGEIAGIELESPTLFNGTINVPLDAKPGMSELSGVYEVKIPDVHPSAVNGQEVLITVESASPTSYKQEGVDGVAYPESAKLAAYTVATIPVKGIKPTVIGNIQLNGNPVGIKTLDYHSYVLVDGTTSDSLTIVHVADANHCFVLKTVTLPNTPTAFGMENGYAFIVDSGSKLQVVDVDPIEDASIVKTVSLPALPNSIAVENGAAFVGTNSNIVNIIDVDPPGSAAIISNMPISGAGPVSDVAVRDGVLYAGAHNLELYDVDPPTSPALLKSVTCTNPLVTLNVSDNGYVYAGDNLDNLQVIDIDPPASAAIIDTLPMSNDIKDIESKGNLAYVAIAAKGLDIVLLNETSGQANIVGSVATSSSPDSISVQDHLAYVDGEVNIIELWDGENPTTVGWGRSWGGSDQDAANKVAVDEYSNSYIVGYFRGTSDFDPSEGVDSHTSGDPDGYDMFLTKLDSSGTYQWARTWGPPPGVGWNNEIKGIAADAYGNVYAVGYFSGACDFEPGPGEDIRHPIGSSAAFLTKFNDTGGYQAALTWGGDNARAFSIAIDSTGNVYVAGWFSGDGDFDPGDGEEILTGSGAFLSKFDITGALVWAKKVGSDKANAVCVDENDSIYVAGGDTAFIERIDPSGNVVWGTQWYGCGSTQLEGWALTAGAQNLIYMVGGFVNPDDGSGVDLDPGAGVDLKTYPVGSQWTAYLCALDSSGVYQWGRTWGGEDYNYSNDVAMDIDGNVCVAGCFSGTAVFEGDPDSKPYTSVGMKDAFVVRYTPAGVFRWAKTFGSADFDEVRGEAIDSRGNTILTGSFDGGIDFDPGPSEQILQSEGGWDGFLVKLVSYGFY